MTIENTDLAVRTAAKIAFEVGEEITGVHAPHFKNDHRSNGTGAEEKGDELAHHAIVTPTDFDAQRRVVGDLSASFPDAIFLAEEKTPEFGDKMVRAETIDALLQAPLAFGVDSLDGSSMHNRELYEHSVSIGVMKNGTHVGGAIYAPDVREGILVMGDLDGVFLKEGDNPLRPVERREDRADKDMLVLVGPDIFLSLPKFGKFLDKISHSVRTMNCIGSCALGLALVAAGKVDALIQPHHYPWDWFAGYPLVTGSGGKILFYRYDGCENNEPTLLTAPDPKSYNPEKRMTAFIAARSPALADSLFDELCETWQKSLS